MFTVIKKIINSPQKFANKILGANIDLPKTGTTNEVEQVIIAGWVLPREEKEAQIIMEGNGREQTFPCDIQRDDVTKTILGEVNPNLKCGFRITLAERGLWKIFFIVEDEKLLIATIDIFSEINFQLDETMKKAIELWNNFIFNKSKNITRDETKYLKVLNNDLIAKYIYKNPIIAVGKLDPINSFLGFNKEEKILVKSFLSLTMNGDFCAILVESILNTGICSIPNPFGEGFAICSESFHFLGSTTLRFVSPSGETFLIIQNPTATDAIYFPTRDFVFCSRVNISEYVLKIVIELCHQFTDILNYTLKASDHKFGGVLASNNRPFHFYYDVCLGLYFLKTRNLINKLPAIYIYEGGEFFSIKELFNAQSCQYIESLSSFKTKSQNNGEFYINVGSNGVDINNRKIIEELDTMILAKSEELIDSKTADEVKMAKECYPLLWFGATVQKRSWLEQVEGGAKIITELAKLYPNIGVVFDGWTSPLNPSKGDIAETAKDQAIVDQIIQLLPQQVKTFSLVGATTVRKLAFATAIDAFIVNYSTGSINVARFAKKHGVGHLSAKMINSAKQLNIHYQTLTVPSDQVVDIPDPNNPGVDFVSYSIDPDVILNMIKEILNENT